MSSSAGGGRGEGGRGVAAAAAAAPALNTQPLLDVVEMETERLRARVAQAVTALQTDAFARLTAQLNAERQQFQATLEEKQERIRFLEVKARDQRHAVDTAAHKMMNLAGQAGSRYRVLDGIRLCRVVYRQWVRYVTLGRRERRFASMPESHFARNIARKVVGGWRTAARASRIGRVEAYWRGQLEDARTLQEGEHGRQVEVLTQQLQQAKEQIRIGVEQRDALEEELKRAFMRGVCALNMEAVSILRHGNPAGVAGAGGGTRESGNEELRQLQAQTGEAMLELSKYGVSANGRGSA